MSRRDETFCSPIGTVDWEITDFNPLDYDEI